MPGPTIQWKTVDTEVVLSEIREPGRYRLASPAAVTGAPSLAMQAAGQNCTVKVYIGGVYRSDALLTVPSTTPVAIRNAVGQPLTGQEMFDMVIEVGNLGFGSVLLTTDEPNGSPSSPFTSAAQLPANPAPGARAWLEMLGGGGIFEVLYTNGSWRPCRGEAIVDLLDPVALIAPGTSTPVDFPICTIPAVLWPEGVCLRFKFMFDCPANTGLDSFSLLQSGVPLLAASVPANTFYPVEMVFQRAGNVTHRRIIIFPSGVATSNPGSFAGGFPADQPIVLRVTPALGTNTFRMRRFSISRD